MATKTLLEVDFVGTPELEQRMNEKVISERQYGSQPFVRYKGLDKSVPVYCVVTPVKQTCAELVHRIVALPHLNRERLQELLYTPIERRGLLMEQQRREIYLRLIAHRIKGMKTAECGAVEVAYEGGEMLVTANVLDELAAVLGDLQSSKGEK